MDMEESEEDEPSKIRIVKDYKRPDQRQAAAYDATK
jgi:hypothetical protein